MDLADPENLSPAREAVDIHRGIVRAYDSTNHKADVMIYGSMSRVVLGVPVAHSIGAELMAVGVDCGVIFFAPSDSGVVLCTFTGAPDPWVTSALIKDGEVAVGDLDFDPATQAELDTHEADVDVHHDTPVIYSKTTAATQAITTSWTLYSTLTQSVTVPEGKTYNVVAIGNAEVGCSSYTGWNRDMVRIYAGGVGKGQQTGYRTNAVNRRATVAVMAAFALTETTTVEVKVFKTQSRNTENAFDGNLVIMAWEAT